MGIHTTPSSTQIYRSKKKNGTVLISRSKLLTVSIMFIHTHIYIQHYIGTVQHRYILHRSTLYTIYSYRIQSVNVILSKNIIFIQPQNNLILFCWSLGWALQSVKENSKRKTGRHISGILLCILTSVYSSIVS